MSGTFEGLAGLGAVAVDASGQGNVPRLLSDLGFLATSPTWLDLVAATFMGPAASAGSGSVVTADETFEAAARETCCSRPGSMPTL